MINDQKPEQDTIRSVLANILTSPQFASSPSVSTTLRYVVNETLEGRSTRIKAYSIAIDALEIKGDFDPSANPIVRVTAGRLREALTAFYQSPQGLEQSVVITVPKGSYVPAFSQPVENQDSSITSIATPEAQARLFSRTVAIKQFDVLSNGGSSESTSVRSELVSAGLQIELIDKLSRFKDFTIIEDIPTPPASNVHILRKVTSQYILTGMIRISEARIIITPTLRRDDDNAIIWSRTYDEVFQNTDALFDIQATIAADIAATLGQPYGTIVSKISAVRPNLGNMDIDHYLALVDYYVFMKNRTTKSYSKVLIGLEKATADIPAFSSAWAALSVMYTYDKSAVNKTVNLKELSNKALSAAQNAVNADPENAMAHQCLALAQFYDADYEGFKKSAVTALRLNPNDAEVLADMGTHFIQLDNSDDGKNMLDRAMQLSPGHPPWYHNGVTIYHYTRHQTDLAIHHARQFSQEKKLSAYILLTAALVQGERLEDAAEVFQELLLKRPIFATEYQSILDNWPLPKGMRKMLLQDLKTAGLVTVP